MYASASGLGIDPLGSRFQPPPKCSRSAPASNKEMWQELDKALGQGLKKKESSIKVFTDFICQTSLETFGPRLIKRAETVKKAEDQRLSEKKRKCFDVIGRRLTKAREMVCRFCGVMSRGELVIFAEQKRLEFGSMKNASKTKKISFTDFGNHCSTLQNRVW